MSTSREDPNAAKVVEAPPADDAALDAAWDKARAAFAADPERFRKARATAPKPPRSLGQRLRAWLGLD